MAQYPILYKIAMILTQKNQLKHQLQWQQWAPDIQPGRDLVTFFQVPDLLVFQVNSLPALAATLQAGICKNKTHFISSLFL